LSLARQVAALIVRYGDADKYDIHRRMPELTLSQVASALGHAQTLGLIERVREAQRGADGCMLANVYGPASAGAPSFDWLPRRVASVWELGAL
jgi:hypothetical protein